MWKFVWILVCLFVFVLFFSSIYIHFSLSPHHQRRRYFNQGPSRYPHVRIFDRTHRPNMAFNQKLGSRPSNDFDLRPHPLRYRQIIPSALWFRIAMNRDVGTGLLARLFTRTAHSLTPELVKKWMIRCLKTTWFCPTVQRPKIGFPFVHPHHQPTNQQTNQTSIAGYPEMTVVYDQPSGQAA